MKLDQIKTGGIIMRRIVAILFCTITILPICSCGYQIKVGDSMSKINSNYIRYAKINTLSVFKTGENYLITIDDGQTIQKLVEFSSERKCRRIQGLHLIESESLSGFLGIGLAEMTAKIGQPHVDIGSGFYIPAYITENAHLIYFEVENGIVTEGSDLDIFTNTIEQIK